MDWIVIVDDDTANLVQAGKILSNHNMRVSALKSGQALLNFVQDNKPDLILLDLMLPGLSGEELLPQIKDIPVIVVSAKADVTDKVELLVGGAADYITKPFDMKELLARIMVQLRKNEKYADKSLLTYREITLDTDKHTVSANGSEQKLTRTEFAIMKLLIRDPEQVVAKLTILDRISLDTPDCTEDSLKSHIYNLRKKLKTLTGKEYISAVWGIGFILNEKS